MTKVMTAQEFYDSITENYTTAELIDKYAKYLLEEHKETILKKQRLSELHTVAFVYIDDIEKAHKQFLANL